MQPTYSYPRLSFVYHFFHSHHVHLHTHSTQSPPNLYTSLILTVSPVTFLLFFTATICACMLMVFIHHHTYMQPVCSQHRLSLAYHLFLPHPPYTPICSRYLAATTLICSLHDHGTACPFIHLSSSQNFLLCHNHSHHTIYIHRFIYIYINLYPITITLHASLLFFLYN